MYAMDNTQRDIYIYTTDNEALGLFARHAWPKVRVAIAIDIAGARTCGESERMQTALPSGQRAHTHTHIITHGRGAEDAPPMEYFWRTREPPRLMDHTEGPCTGSTPGT
jgi:hypothetical protein